MEDGQNTYLVVSVRSIVAIFGILLLGFIILQMGEVFMALYIAFVLALVLNPIVDRLSSRRIPRSLAVGLIYLILVVVVSVVTAAGLHPTITETTRLMTDLPKVLEQAAGISQLSLMGNIPSNLPFSSGGQVLNFTLGLFSNLFFVLSILVFTFYILVEFITVREMILKMVPQGSRKKVDHLLLAMERLLGVYMRGQLLLGLIIGVITYIGLTLIHMPYAMSLALFAGVLEMVPVIGPIISAIPALIVALPLGTVNVASVAILYVLIQQIENNVLVPKVMQRTVGLNPLLTLIILLVGGKLFGLAGVVLAIPTALIMYLVYLEFNTDFKNRKF